MKYSTNKRFIPSLVWEDIFHKQNFYRNKRINLIFIKYILLLVSILEDSSKKQEINFFKCKITSW